MHETVDAWVSRRKEKDEVTLLLSNHTLPRHEIETETVRFELTAAREPGAVFIERIDEDHANARRVWQAMGEPTYPDKNELERLQATSGVIAEPLPWKYENETISLEFQLPPHAVALISLEFDTAPEANRTTGGACT